jgi:ribose-phosphate pyrophosphokinase
MIKIIVPNGSSDGIEVTPTIFPDNTSQVWKLPEEVINAKSVAINWYYSKENELIWVNQLIALLYQTGVKISNLYIPYLPYGRQDKEVGNESSFAKQVFLEILFKEHVQRLTTLDAHSSHPAIISYEPTEYIYDAIDNYGGEDVVVVYPDEGAYNRYKDKSFTVMLDSIVFKKVRNQLTGKIESIDVDKSLSTYDFDNKKTTDIPNFIIIDDISDYGGTFKQVAKELKKLIGECQIGLYVTHFLGHGGLESLYESGINDIFTTDSLTPYRKEKGLDDSRIITLKNRKGK